jgi:hypothetical protein
MPIHARRGPRGPRLVCARGATVSGQPRADAHLEKVALHRVVLVIAECVVMGQRVTRAPRRAGIKSPAEPAT